MTTAKKAWDKILDVATRFAAPLCILIGSVLIGHEVRISSIEGSRFTDRDAWDLEYRLKKDQQGWLKEQVTEIKSAIQRLDDRVRSHMEDVKGK